MRKIFSKSRFHLFRHGIFERPLTLEEVRERRQKKSFRESSEWGPDHPSYDEMGQ